jgi:hypothetical protein
VAAVRFEDLQRGRLQAALGQVDPVVDRTEAGVQLR